MPQLPVILTAFANSYDEAAYLSHLEQENDRLLNILAPLSYLRHIALFSAKTGQLVSTLTQYQQELLILHFGGHADGSQLHFKDAGGQVGGLAENLSLHPQLKLVFLNGCNTQAQAMQYLESGIPAVIATTCSVADGQAMQFSEVFYTALVKGHTLEEAFVRAKGTMKLSGATPLGEEIMNLRGVRLRQEQVTELPWRLYVAGDEVLDWKLEMVDNKIKNLPILLNTVPTNFDPKTDCIGRENELTELHQKLSNSSKVALVRGLGGIGKTTLAMAYVAIHQDKYQHLAWITQGDDLISTVALDQSLALSLEMPLQQGEDLSSRFIQLMQALRGIPGPNLLVIDNATAQVAAPEIFQQLPKAPNWKVLVTSRQDLPDFVVMELQVLRPEAALELFRLYYLGGSDTEAQELLQEIGYHTLTTELLAKTLQRKKGLLSISKLLETLRKRQLDDPKLAEKLWARHSGEERGVFKYLMGLYEIADLSAQETWVLQQFAVLPALPLEVSMLAEWLQQDAEELNQLLADLADRGWLSNQEEGYVVHRLVQELVLYKQVHGAEELDALLDAMSGKMKQDTSTNPVTDNFPWLLYAEKVAAHFAGLEDLPEKVSTLWNNLALVLSDLGHYPRAAQLLESALASNLRNFGEQHPTVAVSQSNLALVYKSLGDYPRAAQLLESALTSDLRNFGEQHPNVARSQSNLALVLSELGDYTRAAQLLEITLDSDLRNFGEQHPTVARSQSNLALVLRNLGDYPRAAKLLESALASNLRNFDEEHPTVAVSQSNLALVLRNLGDYPRAAKLLESALASNLRNFDEEHPTVAVSQSNLALVYKSLEDYTRAAKLLESALASNLRNFGEQHPNVARSQSNLASVLSELGDYPRAAQLLEHALASDLRNFGEEHPNVAVRQSNLANVLSDLGDSPRAAQLLELALASDLRNFGEEHPNVAVHRSSLANILRELGDYPRAAQLLESALASDLSNFGEEHPIVAVHRSNLANVLSELGEYPRAAQLLESVLASDLRNFGEEYPIVAMHRSNLANVLSELGDYTRAAQLLESVLANDLRNFGEKHPNVAVSQFNLAEVYYEVDRLEEAKILLEQALQTVEKSLGVNNPHYEVILSWLDGVNEELNTSS
jgi:tetratricopeptide (TPR) repeat protein